MRDSHNVPFCIRAGPADDDKDVALAVTSDDDSDNDDIAAADDDHAGAGAGSIILSGQARESPSARLKTKRLHRHRV